MKLETYQLHATVKSDNAQKLHRNVLSHGNDLYYTSYNESFIMGHQLQIPVHYCIRYTSLNM